MNKKEIIKKKLFQYFMISLGVIILDVGFYFFLEPAKLVTGGMLGISIILEPFLLKIGSWFTTSIFLYIANVVTLIIGGIMLGKDFFIKTIYASLFSPTLIFILERTVSPNLIMDTVSQGGYCFVALILSSILCGVGIGIAIKFNGSTGGMDVVQKIMSKYLKMPMSKTMYLTDWVVVFFAGFSFVGGFSYNIEMVIYGFIAVFATSYIVDIIVLNAKTRRTAYIITQKPLDIRNAIYSYFDRGVTFSDVTGGYTGVEMTMVICTLDKSEAYRLKEYVSDIDPNAFTFITSCKEVLGEYGRGKRTRWLLEAFKKIKTIAIRLLLMIEIIYL